MFRLTRVQFSRMFRKPLPPPTQYDLELQQWRADMKKTIRQYRREFWELQEEVEDNYIREIHAKQAVTNERLRVKRLESVIRIANRTQNFLAKREERDEERASRQLAFVQQKQEELEKKVNLVQALNVDSTTWITSENAETRIRESLVVPHALNHTEYYAKLRQEAALVYAGKAYSQYDLFNNRTETQLRNSMLYPLFVDVRAAIKMLTYTPLHALQTEYEGTKTVVADCQGLREKYQALADAYYAQDRDDKVYLTRTYEQVKNLADLLKAWDKYVAVLKLEDAELMEMKEDSKVEPGRHMLYDPEQDDKWDEELKDPNPETSDYFLHEESNNFIEASNEHEKLSSVELEDLFDESEKALSEQSEAVETEVESRAALDNLLAEVNREITHSTGMFKELNELQQVSLDPEYERSVFNPSILMKEVLARINTIDEGNLELPDKWTRSETLRLIDKILNSPVEEPQLLLKVFRQHKYDPPVFN